MNNNMRNLILFLIPSLIWGSTWLIIKFQLGVVDPIISVFYRFLLAGLILLAYAKVKGLKLSYTVKEHMLMALLGTCLFGINYWLVYVAEEDLTSGLVAVVFSSLVFLNIFNGAIFLKTKIRKNVLFSGMIGFAGVALVFKDEIANFNFSDAGSFAFILAIISAFTASLGNITSGYIQRIKIPVIQSNAFGMLYGSFVMLAIALLAGKQFTFDFSFSYTLSLFYLTIFGSIFAFGSYLSLLGKIGADKSAYVTLVIPIIALLLSTIFEGYQWDVVKLSGVLLITLGNLLILKKKAPAV